jgi:hypothetical protein
MCMCVVDDRLWWVVKLLATCEDQGIDVRTSRAISKCRKRSSTTDLWSNKWLGWGDCGNEMYSVMTE